MKLIVANVDRSGDIGREIAEAARSRHSRRPDFLEYDYSVMSLRSARDEGEYLDRLTKLMWHRTGIGTTEFYIPRRAGLAGSISALVKKVLWVLLRYQQDRMVFLQNTVNTQLTAAIELVRVEYWKETLELRRKIETLEKRIADLERTK